MLGAGRHAAGYGEGGYDLESRQLVYDDMIRRANALLAQRRSVVLDGTFLAAQWRLQALNAATEHAALPLFVRCECPDTVAIDRIATRGANEHTLSEARKETYRRQKSEVETDPPDISSISITTTRPLPNLLESVFHEITASYANSR